MKKTVTFFQFGLKNPHLIKQAAFCSAKERRRMATVYERFARRLRLSANAIDEIRIPVSYGRRRELN
jgi:hypothetical protein